MKHWISVAEAAEYFDIPAKTLYSLAARGLLGEGAILRLGRTIRIDVEIIETLPISNKRERKKFKDRTKNKARKRNV
jgi:excisionase family DNA binding protein